jgi:S-adenosylmethionine hydrolase
VSPSFHARDVLAPAAAHLAAGKELETLGPALEPSSLTRFTLPEPSVEHGKIVCEVLDLNRFGNVLLNVREPELAASGLERAGAIQVDSTAGSARARWVTTYADLADDDWGIIVDPRGRLLVIRANPGNAAEGLGNVTSGDSIWLTEAGN